ncbi:MAG TPA: polyprenyl synthetase family protein [Patescibacteria group bacterium]|nr:polyprenyl synthetase family protein [Patescibacteria group bacterium]
MPAPKSFDDRLAAYKQAIDDDIASYAAFAQESARARYDKYATLEVDAFLDILARGGKRIRGALVMLGYEMCGGKDQAMIVQAARALEMLHAYMLILDDIQDRAAVRRGKPAAHKMLEEYHRKHHLKGDGEHTGLSLAINVAAAGNHAAQIVLANLNADPQLKLNALSITNRTLMITSHGQSCDIMNEIVEDPEPADLDNVMEWKTALYSFINPLHVGMVLAGAGCQDTDAITPYALHVGKGFQIADDLLGLFGDEKELGKSPMDDMREGKMTVLMAHAIKNSPAKDVTFLRKMLGNQDLTAAEFTRCQEIVKASGAVEYAQERAAQEVDVALRELDTVAHRWPAADVQFLRELAKKMTQRRK